MPARFVEGDSSGWLLVRRVSDNEKVSLPHYLKVDYQRTQQQRDYFLATEGSYKGVSFSVALKASGGSYLTTSGMHLAAGNVRFSLGTKQLWYGGTGPIGTITDPGNPIPRGTFDLEIPDYPHAGGAAYTGRSQYAKAWFRVRPGGANTSVDRYLHTGRISAGCVTVIEVEKWTAIFSYLINRRKNDVSVGTITIVA